jgi:hypothetical protein
MQPQNNPDGHQPDAMIKVFTALHHNTKDATHLTAIYISVLLFIRHESSNMMYISDEQLHTMELCIYHAIKVQVDVLNGERRSEMCGCVESQSWSGEDQWNIWLWVKQRLWRSYGVLDGHLPWQLQ